MPKFTNDKGLPTPVYNMTVEISNSYHRGESDISTTELIFEPLQRILRREYDDQVVEDVSECQHRIMGSILHKYLAETEGDEGCIKEQRLFIEVDDWTVSGEPDYYSGLENKVLTDYKYTAKYKTRNEIPEEWIKQLNIYAYMLKQFDRECDKLQFCVWQRDAYKSAKDEAVKIVDCPMYTDKQIEEYLLKRVKFHQVSDPEYNKLIDLGGVPECSEKMRLHSPAKFALMKKGRKGAIKLYDNKAKAESAMPDEKNYWVQERDAVNKFCTDYCNYAKWCQYEQDRGKAIEEKTSSESM